MTTAEKYSLLINEKIPATFEAGKAQGSNAEFWVEFQQKGDRKDYRWAFAFWSDKMFKPVYDITPSTATSTDSASYMFYRSTITSLKGRLEELGVSLNLSKTGNIFSMFEYSKIKDFPILDCANCSNISYAFKGSGVETVEKLVLSDKLNLVSSAFAGANNLRHIIFEGTIAVTGFNLGSSENLDAESYYSLIKCYDKTKALTLTLPPEKTVRSVYDAKYGSGAWDTITAEYSNLTIAYS